jgi:RNA polymerase sigma factor (sigma-70 family)
MQHARLQLIEAARSGQSGAVLELMRVCQPDVQRFARRTCSSSEDAEDAVQEALWRLYRHIGALRTAATLATWLFRIVERECYRLFRGRTRAEALDDLPDAEMPAALATPVDLRLDLARVVESLAPPYREVLILRDVHELTAPEVALQLGLSVEAVKSRLHRARGIVRTQLQSSGYWRKDDLRETAHREV